MPLIKAFEGGSRMLCAFTSVTGSATICNLLLNKLFYISILRGLFASSTDYLLSPLDFSGLMAVFVSTFYINTSAFGIALEHNKCSETMYQFFKIVHNPAYAFITNLHISHLNPFTSHISACGLGPRRRPSSSPFSLRHGSQRPDL